MPFRSNSSPSAVRDPGNGTVELFPLWGKAWPSLEVAGVGYRKAEIVALLGGTIPDAGAQLETEAILRRDPTNAHDPNAVAVDVHGQHVGFLPADEAVRYRDVLTRMETEGLVPVARAQLWASTWEAWEMDEQGDETTEQRISCTVRLALDEPHLITPANQPPAAAHHLLPQGHSVKVGGTADALPMLAPHCPAEGQAWVYVTMHALTEQLARSVREVVEVRLEGAPIGKLTPKMSEQFLPAIAMLEQGNRLAVGRALLKGNSLKVDVTLHAERVQNLSSEWVAAREREARSVTPLSVQTTDPGLGVPAQVSMLRFEDSAWPPLIKGQNIELPSEDVHVALSWRAGPEVDVTALLISGGTVRGDADLVFYNQPVHPSGAVRVGPVTAVGSYVDVALSRVEADVESIVLTASADGAPFRDVRGLSIDMSTALGPLARYAVTDAQSETAFVMAEIYRRNGAWRFRAVGQGYNSGLAGLATEYGVNIDD